MKVDLFSIPKVLSARVLGSASEYIIVSQCLRNLTKIDENGQISGDLASSWDISPDFKTFVFNIRPDQKFSNGETIQPADIVESWQHPDFKKIAIHFDFHMIERLLVEGQKLKVTLKNSNPFFLYTLRNPEFGVFHKSDRTGRPTLKIASGPYFLKTFAADHIDLLKNPHFTHEGPDRLEFVAKDKDVYSALLSNQLDLAMLGNAPTPEEEKMIRASKDLKISIPHIGFTFWITLNPNSQAFESKPNREVFQAILKGRFDSVAEESTTWIKANQLFLPEGPGRITKDAESSFWKKRSAVKGQLKHVKQLNGIITKRFQFGDKLESTLKAIGQELGVQIHLAEYDTQEQFTNLLKEKSWDFYLINNDFSSYELVQNLIVTFNNTKPLIVLPPRQKNLWSEIQKAPEAEVRHKKIEALAQDLLEDALIVPLLYKQVPIFARNNVDLSAWSSLFPEFAFWKVRLKNHVTGRN